MRVEKSGNGGFTCVRNFLRNALTEQIVALRAPNHRDASDYASQSWGQVLHYDKSAVFFRTRLTVA